MILPHAGCFFSVPIKIFDIYNKIYLLCRTEYEFSPDGE